jgi:tetratricopeptide (TPR) repeat protein
MLSSVAADGNAVEMLERARRQYEAHRYQECLETLTQAGDDALDNPEFWFLRAAALRHLGKVKEAIKTARTGLELSPEHIGLLDSLGLALMEKRDLAGADKAFRTALALAPEHTTLLAHHAMALADLGRLKEAETVYATLLRIDPDSSQALETRARLAVRFRDPAADSFVAELLAHDPENQVGQLLRGTLALRRKQAGNAAEAFHEAAALNPGDAQVAKVARASRIVAHPLLAPSRWILMLGSGRARLVYIAMVVVLRELHQTALAVAWLFFWLIFVLIAPRALRIHYKRRYGSL